MAVEVRQSFAKNLLPSPLVPEQVRVVAERLVEATFVPVDGFGGVNSGDDTTDDAAVNAEVKSAGVSLP